MGLDIKLGGKTNEKSLEEGVEKHDEKRTQLKRSRSQFSAWPDGMREAPGENKELGGVEVRRVEISLTNPARRAHRQEIRRCRRCQADPKAPCGATPPDTDLK